MLQGTPKRLEQLIDQWAAGIFRNIPEIILLPNEDISGAMGAYAISTRKIYLNQDWLLGASAAQVISVLTEELAHHLDGQFNDADTPGDEGEYLGRLLSGENPVSGTKIGLRQQGDRRLIRVNGDLVGAEFATTTLIHGNSLYMLIDGTSWDSAESNSTALGGHLVTINTRDENDFLLGSLPWISPTPTGGAYLFKEGIAYWIGLSDANREGEYAWSSGESLAQTLFDYRDTPNQDTSYEDWFTLMHFNEPSYSQHGKWNDIDQNSTYWNTQKGIAEIPLNLSITHTGTTKEGAGLFTTSINLTAGTQSSGNLAEGARVWWKINGITGDDLASSALTGSGAITNGKLDIQHSLIVDADTGEQFSVSVYSDAAMTQQIGTTSSTAVQEATSTQTVSYTSFSSLIPGVIGIDYSPTIQNLVLTANYPSGIPWNLYTLSADQVARPYSGITGYTDELKIAVVKQSSGGFIEGELFIGTGIDGEIAKISSDGKTTIKTWCQLPQAPGVSHGLFRGSFFHDNTGSFDNDLIAVTTLGEVWRINSSGTPTQLAALGTQLEGLTVAPESPLYGPLSGKILIGAEGQNRLYTVSNTGEVGFYDLDVAIEDIDIVPGNEDFYGVDYAGSRILRAPASDFQGLEGEILVVQEGIGYAPSGLYRLIWNGQTLDTQPFQIAGGSESPGQWEHVTFAPSKLGVTIPGDGQDPAFDFNLNNILVITGPGSGTVDGSPFSNTFSIDLSLGNDTGSINESAGVSTLITVNGGDGIDALNGNSLDNILVLTGINQGTLDGVSFSNIENINLGGGNDTVYILPGGQLTGLLDGGGTGSSVVYLPPGTTPPGGGGGGVVIPPPTTPPTGPPVFFPPSQPPGITVNGGYNSFILNDNANNVSITGPGSGVIDGTTFINFYSIDMRGGADTATIASGGSLLGTLDGGADQDTLNLNDATNALTLGADLTGTIKSSTGPLTSIANFEVINLAAGSDAATVDLRQIQPASAAVRKTLTINGGTDTPINASIDTLLLTLSDADITALQSNGSLQALLNYLRNPTGLTYTAALANLDLTLTGFESASLGNAIDLGQGTPGSITSSGALQEGVTLTAPSVTGDPNGDAAWTSAAASPSYQWLFNGVAISGATAATYTVPPNAIAAASTSAQYSVQIIYTDAGGYRNTDAPVTSAAVTVNKINNTPVGTLSAITGNGALQEGVTLTAGSISADTDGNASITGYKWFRNGIAIDTAIASTYLVPPGGSGSYMVRITYTDGQGYSATVDSATQPVSAPPPPSTTTKIYTGDYDFTITGTPVSGRVVATQKVKVGKTTSTVTRIDETFANVQTVDITAGASANIINAQSWTGDAKLKGEAGNDTITGGSGINTYTGGVGADKFRFTLKPEFTASLADHITDFSGTQKDKIEISRSAFGIGKTAKVSITSVNGSTARDAALAQASLLVYDSSTGELWWNQNGSTAGAGSGGVFAILDNQPASLAASAIALIA